MNASAYTYENVEELVDVGMPEAQAKVVVRQQAEFKDGLVTMQHHDLTIELLRKEMAMMKRDLIIWLGGAIVAATTIIINFRPVVTP